MKKLGFLIAGVSLLMSGALFASVRPCPGEFSFTAEWIYLEPIIDNPFYVLKQDPDIDQKDLSDPIGCRRANQLDYDSGFRLEAMYAFCDCKTDFRLAWTHLDTDNKDRVKGDRLLATIGHPDDMEEVYEFASSNICFDFDRVEGVFGYHLLDCGCLDLVLEFGLQYANFETKTKNKFIQFQTVATAPTIVDFEDINDLNVYKTRSCYWGIGPQIGLDLNYCLCGNFSFVATADWALLVGENDTKSFLAEPIKNGNPVEDIDVKSKNECIYRIVPATHIRAGLNYGFGCGCWDFNIEAGYQFYSYLRALDTVEYVVGDPNQNQVSQEARSLDIYSNADMHGPYVSVTFNF